MDCRQSDRFTSVEYADYNAGDVNYVYCQCGARNALQLKLVDFGRVGRIMTKEEKILLLQLILEDLRGCWVCNTMERVEEAKKLAKELGYSKRLLKLIGS